MVDLAAVRDAMKKLGSDPNNINPLVCIVFVLNSENLRRFFSFLIVIFHFGYLIFDNMIYVY